jgi:hypothetical protein
VDEALKMTITLALAPHEDEKLIALARARGVSKETLLREALEGILAGTPERGPEPKPGSVPVWEEIASSMKDLPTEDLALLPRDGASQIDHYVYGLSKSPE